MRETEKDVREDLRHVQALLTRFERRQHELGGLTDEEREFYRATFRFWAHHMTREGYTLARRQGGVYHKDIKVREATEKVHRARHDLYLHRRLRTARQLDPSLSIGAIEGDTEALARERLQQAEIEREKIRLRNTTGSPAEAYRRRLRNLGLFEREEVLRQRLTDYSNRYRGREVGRVASRNWLIALDAWTELARELGPEIIKDRPREGSPFAEEIGEARFDLLVATQIARVAKAGVLTLEYDPEEVINMERERYEELRRRANIEVSKLRNQRLKAEREERVAEWHRQFTAKDSEEKPKRASRKRKTSTKKKTTKPAPKKVTKSTTKPVKAPKPVEVVAAKPKKVEVPKPAPKPVRVSMKPAPKKVVKLAAKEDRPLFQWTDKELRTSALEARKAGDTPRVDELWREARRRKWRPLWMDEVFG